LLQFHDGHSSIILNQLSHFFNQRNSGNFLTALRIFRPRSVSTIETCLSVTFESLHFFRRDPPTCFSVEVIFWPLSRTDFPPLKQRFILVN